MIYILIINTTDCSISENKKSAIAQIQKNYSLQRRWTGRRNVLVDMRRPKG